ncbi:hypothetical protein HGRIS_005354 [Hohenbuehelia grisea]|uniref:Major facilitator superfamily (MFS) profile domain-containing protein n=1 Tax=Hohenbuehelia grisea TaxID=104357 RepID=A0ABR3JET6_9AGAR
MDEPRSIGVQAPFVPPLGQDNAMAGNAPESSNDADPPLVSGFTHTERKLLLVVGTALVLDAYDMLIINAVATMLQFRLYNGRHLPPFLEGLVKSGAVIGTPVGEIIFGYMASIHGRRPTYVIELIVIIVATILCLSTPTGSLSPKNSLVFLGCFRILLGVGIGGDWTLSMPILIENSLTNKRGKLLSGAAAFLGVGALAGNIVAVSVLACYKTSMADGNTSKFDGVWRIIVGMSLVPAFGTLYLRVKLPESARYEEFRPKRLPVGVTNTRRPAPLEFARDTSSTRRHLEPERDSRLPWPDSGAAPVDSGFLREFCRFYSQWDHCKLLVGASIVAFSLNVVAYGVILNQNFVLQQIGFGGRTGTPWQQLFRISVGSLIATTMGYLPGYIVTVFTIERLGRKWIAVQGFVSMALFWLRL